MLIADWIPDLRALNPEEEKLATTLTVLPLIEAIWLLIDSAALATCDAPLNTTEGAALRPSNVFTFDSVLEAPLSKSFLSIPTSGLGFSLSNLSSVSSICSAPLS